MHIANVGDTWDSVQCVHDPSDKSKYYEHGQKCTDMHVGVSHNSYETHIHNTVLGNPDFCTLIHVCILFVLLGTESEIQFWRAKVGIPKEKEHG